MKVIEGFEFEEDEDIDITAIYILGDGTRELRILRRPREETERLLAMATREALLMHKREANPIAVERDGKLVILQPDEIEIEPEPKPKPNE